MKRQLKDSTEETTELGNSTRKKKEKDQYISDRKGKSTRLEEHELGTIEYLRPCQKNQPCLHLTLGTCD